MANVPTQVIVAAFKTEFGSQKQAGVSAPEQAAESDRSAPPSAPKTI
jgi:hypothetical protein